MPQQLVFSQCLQLRTDGGRKVLAEAIDGHPVTKCGAEVCFKVSSMYHDVSFLYLLDD